MKSLRFARPYNFPPLAITSVLPLRKELHLRFRPPTSARAAEFTTELPAAPCNTGLLGSRVQTTPSGEVAKPKLRRLVDASWPAEYTAYQVPAMIATGWKYQMIVSSHCPVVPLPNTFALTSEKLLGAPVVLV